MPVILIEKCIKNTKSKMGLGASTTVISNNRNGVAVRALSNADNDLHDHEGMAQTEPQIEANIRNKTVDK